MSVDQLAQLTGLPVETVIALERNDLSRLSAGIDPSTALRAYATAVGLDADKVVQQYLRVPNLLDESISSDTKAGEIMWIDPADGDPEEFPSELEVEPESDWMAAPPKQPATSQYSDSDERALTATLPSPPVSTARRKSDDIGAATPRGTSRFYVAAGAAAVIALTVYSTMWKTPTRSASSPAQPSAARPAPARSSGVPHSSGDDPARVGPHSGDDAVLGGGNSKTATARPGRETRSATAPAQQANHSTSTASSPSEAEDLDGWWEMTNHVQAASYSAYRGLRLGYRLQLQQNGTQITGQGYKWTENGRRISTSSRTPIKVDGIVEGRRVTLSFTEHGVRRTSAGTFRLKLTDGSLSGTFESDAARSRGISVARRTSPAERVSESKSVGTSGDGGRLKPEAPPRTQR